MLSAFLRIWKVISPWFWPATALIFAAALILVAVQPWRRPPEPEPDDIAKAWNNSISHFGIDPIFPPQEDFHVGDVWLVVAGAEKEPFLLNKAVRLGHIDLRRDMLNSGERRPVFGTLPADPKDGGTSRPSSLELAEQLPDDRLFLRYTAFPGINIRHAARAKGSFATVFGGLAAGRDVSEIEEIRIPLAETYGASIPAAGARLAEWCTNEQSKFYCTDSFARRVMAYAIGRQVLAATQTESGETRYRFSLELLLVTRVFLMREIEHRRVQDASTGTGWLARLEPARPSDASPPAAPTSAAGPPPGGSREEHNRNALDSQEGTVRIVSAPLAVPSAGGSILNADGTMLWMHQVFPRPIAFGFRAIKLALIPSQPSEKGVP